MHYHKENGKKIAYSINNDHHIVDQLKESLNKADSLLFICSNPDSFQTNDEYARLLFEACLLSSISFKEYHILDTRTSSLAKNYINQADLIFLSGGDPYIQNEYFKKIGLKALLEDYDGLIMGQSAGSINLADDVFNTPEYGPSSDPKTIYYHGLGLGTINIEPHFILDTGKFDENSLFQREQLIKESNHRIIYCVTDGSHIVETRDAIQYYGDIYLLQSGVFKKNESKENS